VSSASSASAVPSTSSAGIARHGTHCGRRPATRQENLYALPYIYGVGPRNAKKILAETGVNPDARVRDLRDAEVARLRQVIERDYKVEGALRTEVAMNIKRLMDIGTYRGTRHRKNLPVRGQRTHTKRAHQEGPRRAIAGKKKPLLKK